MKTADATITGHRMSRNQHREPVCRITLVGPHVINRFAARMLDHQMEFWRMGKAILAGEPESGVDRTVDGFRRYEDEYGQSVVEITLVCWHSIHRFAHNMLGWQVEFSAMGRKILQSHRRDVGPVRWKSLWAMYHGTGEPPMTFHWGRDV